MLDQAPPKSVDLQLKKSFITINPAEGKRLLRLWITSPSFILVLTGIITYWGVWQLGLAMDEWSALEDFRTKYPTSFEILLYAHSNRFPIWSSIIFPFLIQASLWFSHSFLIAAQITNSLLLTKLLERVGFGRVPALVAGLFFLVWPSHSETLMYMIASAPVWGAMFVLTGLHLALSRHYVWAVVLVFLGTLNSEGIILPAIFSLFLVLLYQRLKWWRWLVYLAGLGGLLVGFQLLRLLVNGNQPATAYAIGFNNSLYNIGHLSFMQIGQATSQDVAWFWGFYLKDNYTYTGFVPGYNAVLLAALLAGIVGVLALRYSKPNEFLQPTGLKFTLTWGGVLVLGWLSALALFLVLQGNLMQTRYTYSMTFFFCIFVAFLLYQVSYRVARLLSNRERAKNYARLGLGWGLVALLTWSLFLGWGTTLRNWYPAKLLTDKMIADFQQVGRETGINQIYLVNPISAVGNAYTLSASWAFRSVGHLFLTKDTFIDGVSYILQDFPTTQAPVAKKFTDKRCIFLGWKDGKAVRSDQLAVPDFKLLLDCATGWARPLTTNDQPALTYLYNNSSEYIKQFGIKP